MIRCRRCRDTTKRPVDRRLIVKKDAVRKDAAKVRVVGKRGVVMRDAAKTLLAAMRVLAVTR